MLAVYEFERFCWQGLSDNTRKSYLTLLVVAWLSQQADPTQFYPLRVILDTLRPKENKKPVRLNMTSAAFLFYAKLGRC